MKTVILASLFGAFASNGTSGLARSPVTGPDLHVEHGTYADPPPVGFYSYFVSNHSEQVAANVRLVCETPGGATFYAVYVDAAGADGPTRCETPPRDESGEILIRLGSLAPDAFVSVEIWLAYTGERGTDVSMRLTARSDSVDANEEDNGYTYENFIPGPPPVVTIDDVRARHDPERGFEIEITGTNFSSFNTVVGIGCDCQPWYGTAEMTDTRIILVGGAELRHAFPRGIPTRICVGGAGLATGYATYTRPKRAG